jgi:hypothetical protein
MLLASGVANTVLVQDILEILDSIDFEPGFYSRIFLAGI